MRGRFGSPHSRRFGGGGWWMRVTPARRSACISAAFGLADFKVGETYFPFRAALGIETLVASSFLALLVAVVTALSSFALARLVTSNLASSAPVTSAAFVPGGAMRAARLKGSYLLWGCNCFLGRTYTFCPAST